MLTVSRLVKLILNLLVSVIPLNWSLKLLSHNINVVKLSLLLKISDLTILGFRYVISVLAKLSLSVLLIVICELSAILLESVIGFVTLILFCSLILLTSVNIFAVWNTLVSILVILSAITLLNCAYWSSSTLAAP